MIESVYEEVLPAPHLNLMGDPESQKDPASFRLESNPSYRVPAHINVGILASSSCREVKKNRSCFYIICSIISFVILGVLASVSMTMTVWSITKPGNPDCGDQSLLDQSLLDSITNNFSTAIKSLQEEIQSVHAFLRQLKLSSATLQSGVNLLNLTLEAVSIDVASNIRSLGNVSMMLDSLLGEFQPLPALSCLQLSNYSPSGYYLVRASNGSAVRVYCDMSRSCGNVTGGWMRVANLNFETSFSSCPAGFRERNDSGILTCGINSTSAGCASLKFDTYGIPYTRVCGKVLAYQFGTTDAFGGFGLDSDSITIDTPYVDGVSLTHGTNPRHHIWTFAAAFDEYGLREDGRYVCECSHSARNGRPPPAFVGQDYFCDSGQQHFTGLVFSPFPLWDGAGCGPNSTCCTFNNPPWFHKELSSSTIDPIEMRVCSDEDRRNEDVAMSSTLLYIQ